jgi:DNA-directed RNA polymerase specialized sigma24 family protein
VPGLRPTVTNRRRADLDALAYELRRQGLTYREIGERLGVTDDMARRRVIRYQRTMREEAGKGADWPSRRE